MQLPIGVFATSIAVAIFPTMTQQASTGDYPELKRSIGMGLRTSFYMIIPSAVGLIMLREPIIRFLYEFSGEFTAHDTYITGQALLYYCIGLAAYGAILIALRGFYAIQNTLIPLLISVAAIIINVLFSVILVDPMGHCGLALAYSLAGIAQFLLLMYFLRRKIGQMGLRYMGKSLLQIVIACVVMALAVWGASELCVVVFGIETKIAQLLQVAVAVVVGVVVYIICTGWMRMEEFTMVKNMIKTRIQRRKANK